MQEVSTVSPSSPPTALAVRASLDAALERIRLPVAALILAGFVLLGHAASISTGLYLDDYAHYEHLKDGDWSYRSAVDAARLGIVGEVLDLWGRQEAGLRFYRPVAFWVMRAEYTLIGWRPAAMHAFSLTWHYACCALIGLIVYKFLGRRFWGVVAACLAAIHPGQISTVHWIACQTELMTTCFLLAGILAYSRHAGWPEPWCGVPARDDSLSRSAQTQGNGFAFISIVCYALALGCRENATLFPAVCWLGDRLIGTRRGRWLRWEHLAMGGVFGVYLLLRWHALGGFPVPPPPYLQPVSASFEFVQYLIYKVVTYTLGLFCFIPVVPIGSRSYFSQQPGIFYGVFAGVIALIVVIIAAYGWRKAMLWPLVWMALLFAPVMLVFASPHHLYLPGLGMVVLVTAGLNAIAGVTPASASRHRRARIAIGTGLLTTLGVGLGLVSWGMSFAYTRGVLAEDLVVRDVLQQRRPLRDGDHLFFINLPVLAYYAVPAVEQELGYRNLHGHVLTFGPDFVRMEAASTVDVLDAHRLRVRAPQGHPYLSGITGNMLLGVMRIDSHLAAGQKFETENFTVTLTNVDSNGVNEMIFDFRRPLDSSDYHFYLGSPQFMAYELTKPQINTDEH